MMRCVGLMSARGCSLVGGCVRGSVGLAFVVVLMPASTAAYSAPGLYAGSPGGEGGGGGRYFTGSRRDGYACSVCHVGGAGPTVTLAGAPVGAYEPGAVYTFDLRVDPGARTRVALTAEVVDADGAGLGQLSLAPRDLLTDEERCAGGGRGGMRFDGEHGRQVVALQDCLATRLRVQWHAPGAGHGAAFVHIAAVAADGEGTPENDGVALVRREVAELGADAGDGCRAGGRSGAAGLLPLGLVARRRGRRARTQRAAHAWRCGRRAGTQRSSPPWCGRRTLARVWRWVTELAGRVARLRRRASAMGHRGATWRRAAMVLVFAALTTGCARVKPYERGRLARPDMQLAVDEDLAAGQLHATEYREGSVGGEGGGGGGCGCN